MAKEEFYAYQEETFDAFCKAVIRNESIDAKRKADQQEAREVPFSALPPQMLETFAYEDCCPAETYRTFQTHGSTIAVTDWALGAALASLPPQRRDVILLSYFLHKSDSQIGEMLHISPHTVRYRKMVALERLRTALEMLAHVE